MHDHFFFLVAHKKMCFVAYFHHLGPSLLIIIINIIITCIRFASLPALAPHQMHMKRLSLTVLSVFFVMPDMPTQVKAALFSKDWIWVGDSFVSSDSIAFQAPPAADSFLRQASTYILYEAESRASGEATEMIGLIFLLDLRVDPTNRF